MHSSIHPDHEREFGNAINIAGFLPSELLFQKQFGHRKHLAIKSNYWGPQPKLHKSHTRSKNKRVQVHTKNYIISLFPHPASASKLSFLVKI